ncbi:hypothetical protein DV495_000594 [Geotrichum candidum]|uniref:Type 1 phosphatases regulator n=1 Tax=Geotrichum candidum TaxID=1173061 RepID=A0A0J9XDV2_GEOCN|nr:hypothetical protein DV452_002445 [Geotrichum candidum]KAI9213357.1 hypothetical protein DS838_001769 [Geotrichum bryndzae]KAF5135684.1 hypothetical protein DV495_000594 [Geotrichum candidum]KAF7498680.1 hypothetical protein DV113_003276 [Geotrichum candidum]KAI8135593.1 hypothetical protein DUD61_000808 [Geotrichum candidum]
MSIIPSTITTVITETEPSAGTLHLEAQERGERPGVRWTDDVIDNEHMNKKKSKICCIFHKTREFGESSSESDSSSSSSSSDSDSDFEGFGNDNSAPGRRNLSKDEASDSEKEDHEHGENCNHNHANERRRRRKHKKSARESSPNAYERQPKYTPKTHTSGNVNSIDNRP